jgi:hypothetical protein
VARHVRRRSRRVRSLDAEDLAWCRDAAFWRLIERRRKEKTISRAELEARLNLLLETSPRLIAECARIRREMRAGKYYAHEEVKRILGLGAAPRRGARIAAKGSARKACPTPAKSCR